MGFLVFLGCVLVHCLNCSLSVLPEPCLARFPCTLFFVLFNLFLFLQFNFHYFNYSTLVCSHLAGVVCCRCSFRSSPLQLVFLVLSLILGLISPPHKQLDSSLLVTFKYDAEMLAGNPYLTLEESLEAVHGLPIAERHLQEYRASTVLKSSYIYISF